MYMHTYMCVCGCVQYTYIHTLDEFYFLQKSVMCACARACVGVLVGACACDTRETVE